MRQRITVYHYIGYSSDTDGLSGHVLRVGKASRHRHVVLESQDFAPRRPGWHPVKWLRLHAAPEGNLAHPADYWRCLRMALALRPRLRAQSRRVFVGHSRAGNVVAALLVLLGCRSQALAQVHTLGKKHRLYQLLHWVLRDRLIWLTPGMPTHYGLASADGSCVIPTPIEHLPDCVDVTALRDPQGRITIGGLGLLVEWKGWATVLDALDRLPPDLPVTFRHAGSDGPAPADAVFADAMRSRAGTRAAFTGWTDDVPGFIAGTTCVIIPSLSHEATSNVFFEALRANRRVIVSDACTLLVPLVQATRSGWTFPAGDAAALAALLQRLTTEPDPPATLDLAPLAPFKAATVVARWDERIGQADSLKGLIMKAEC